MYEVCSEKALKALLAIDGGDSIALLSRKIDENRETIRRALTRLEDAGYVEYDDGLFVTDPAVREAGHGLLMASAGVSPPTVSEAYVLPHFAGLDFAYTGIDAVYVWTRGGYQVARKPEDYPLFLAIEENDLEEWERFFSGWGIPVNQERQSPDDVAGAIQVVLEIQDTVDAEQVDGRPVIPLDETVAFAREHYATFQSALDMLGRMYDDVDAETNYHIEPAE